MAAAHPLHPRRLGEVRALLSRRRIQVVGLVWFCSLAQPVSILSSCFLCRQVQRCVQVPAERAARAVTAAALLGPADAEEAPQVHPDGRRQVATAQPHGLPDRQPAVLLTGEMTGAFSDAGGQPMKHL